LQLGGEPFPIAEPVGYNDSNSYESVAVSQNGTMVYKGGAVSKRQLIWFDRTGKQQETVGPSGEVNDIVLSRDGKRLAMQRLDGGEIDIWLMDLARGVPCFYLRPGSRRQPGVVALGTQVVFSSAESVRSISPYRKVSSGAGTQELFKSDVTKESTDWSKDGRFIVFQADDPKTGTDLWVLPLFGEGKPYPLLHTEFNEVPGFFSPDGRWLAYTSNESGRNEVYVQTFPQTGGKWLISSGGGAQPHWGGDGKELFYVAPDRTLMAVEVNAASTFETGAPKPLFATQVNGYNAPNRYVVSADGQRFLVNSPAGEVNQTPITVVLNWANTLKR
jgi:Tol biopolymer transport system component